jgi:hypothetical protein
MLLARSTLFASIALVLVAGVNVAFAGTDCETKFAENVSPRYRTAECSAVIRSLPYTVSGLKQCYRNTGLYFSNPETVCSPNCLEPTIEAAKKIADACPIDETYEGEEDNAPQHVYQAWANEEAAKISCGKLPDGKYCISLFSSLAVQAANYELAKKNESFEKKYDLADVDWRKEFDCDGPCTVPLYKALKGNGKLAPSLYFYVYDGLYPVFKVLEEVCGIEPETEQEEKKDCDGSAPSSKSTEPVY